MNSSPKRTRMQTQRIQFAPRPVSTSFRRLVGVVLASFFVFHEFRKIRPLLNFRMFFSSETFSFLYRSNHIFMIVTETSPKSIFELTSADLYAITKIGAIVVSWGGGPKTTGLVIPNKKASSGGLVFNAGRPGTANHPWRNL